MRSSTTAKGEASSSKKSSKGQNETTKKTRIIRIIGRSLLSVIFLVGLAMVICWLVVFPKNPRIFVETGRVIAHNSTHNMLNATIVFTVKCYNPNKRASVHLHSMRMIVTSMGQAFSSVIPTFMQTPGNQTVLSPAVEVNFDYPFGHQEEINPELHFSAEISYSVEHWTSRPRLLLIYCNNLLLRINDTRTFENTKCNVDL
ncbi:uncharacterized protein LOC105434469 [Cucumis sativus]|uniref:Uncharacterized protein n=1 Tax=Cucumis sativus TaxID=3659 RepID=A0A0A0LVK9_CUCSA|nr:uncharacterized protein LOC105434469 [Cucumis sativus]KGN64867.1 hypothetical protein Csa_022804 [Cucumis sativus]